LEKKLMLLPQIDNILFKTQYILLPSTDTVCFMPHISAASHVFTELLFRCTVVCFLATEALSLPPALKQ
jgi:hypothetical protein